MEEFFGALLRGLGQALAFFYDLIPSYGAAIILLTIAVRLLILPLAIKQTRSMQAMGKLQPKLKEIQRKHKGNRQKISEETMKLYKEHRVNPLGGCLPLLLQLPIFFALFSVLRAATPEIAIPAEPVALAEVQDAFCRPVGEPDVSGLAPNELECDTTGDGEFDRRIAIERWQERDGQVIKPLDVLTRCTPQEIGESGNARFFCETPVGTGHLPEDSELFADVIDGGEPFLGIQLSCGATQAQSEDGIRQCAPRGTEAGGAPLVGYYGLIALMVVSTWYQTRQMQATSGQQAQMQMMARIMPIFLGFISLTIPAGVLLYWVTTNGWQIGQQYVMLRAREAEAERSKAERAKPQAVSEGSGDGKGSQAPRAEEKARGDRSKSQGKAGPQGGRPRPRKGKGGRSRKKRRKR